MSRKDVVIDEVYQLYDEAHFVVVPQPLNDPKRM
jgi:hypothetical protein